MPGNSEGGAVGGIRRLPAGRPRLAVVHASEEEMGAHREFVSLLEKQSGKNLWSLLEHAE